MTASLYSIIHDATLELYLNLCLCSLSSVFEQYLALSMVLDVIVMFLKEHCRGSVMQASTGGQIVFCTGVWAKPIMSDTCNLWSHLPVKFAAVWAELRAWWLIRIKGEINRLVSTRSLIWHTFCPRAHPVKIFPKGNKLVWVSLLLLFGEFLECLQGCSSKIKWPSNWDVDVTVWRLCRSSSHLGRDFLNAHHQQPWRRWLLIVVAQSGQSYPPSSQNHWK